MAYIHSRGFVHRDLKPSNILLLNGNIKICDLGTAALLKGNSMTSRLGTPVFMAPEMLTDAEHTMYTHRIDVFAFGIVMWIIATGLEPYADIQATNSWDLVRRVQKGTRPARCAENIPISLWKIMCRCWSSDPAIRPEFSAIQRELANLFYSEPSMLTVWIDSMALNARAVTEDTDKDSAKPSELKNTIAILDSVSSESEESVSNDEEEKEQKEEEKQEGVDGEIPGSSLSAGEEYEDVVIS